MTRWLRKMDRKITYGMKAIAVIIFMIVMITAIQWLFAYRQLQFNEDPYNRSVTDDYCVKMGYEYVREAGLGNLRECCKTASYVDTIIGKLPLKTVCSGYITKDGWQ